MNKKKKSTVRNYSIAALVFALLACIATFFLLIIRGLVSMELFPVSNPENIQRYLFAAIGLIVLGLAVYAIMEPDNVRRFFTGRQARYGSNSLVMSLAFLGILIVGNVLAVQNPKQIMDLTEDKANTLSPELLNALKGLPEDVTATGFFTQGGGQQAEELLSNIKANSNGKFEYQFVNPDLDPQTAIAAGITGNGKILLQMGDRKEIVASASETEILKGLLRLLNPGNNVIYFLIGHGERDVERGGDSSMTRARTTLESKNYSVKTLNLIAENNIPEDASLIVIAGPLKPVSENEVKLLKDYLGAGGSLIVMQDPNPLTEFGDSNDPIAEMLTTDWGITLDNDIVIDLNSPQPTAAAAAFYDATHAITRNMNTLVTYFPFTQSLQISEGIEGITLTALVQTRENSWGEKDFESLTQGNGPPSLDETRELAGPLTLVVAGENSTTGGRVVVFGGSNFAIDPNFDAYGNGDMFVNSADWAAEQEDIGGITPKTPTERSFIPPAPVQGIIILLGSIFLIPGLVILGGISSWISRRRQG